MNQEKVDLRLVRVIRRILHAQCFRNIRQRVVFPTYEHICRALSCESGNLGGNTLLIVAITKREGNFKLVLLTSNRRITDPGVPARVNCQSQRRCKWLYCHKRACAVAVRLGLLREDVADVKL